MNKTDFQNLLQQKANRLLLDIREAEELTEIETITDSIHMPMGKVFTEAMKGNLPKDKQIVVF